MDIPYQFVSRREGQLSYDQLNKTIIQNHKLIINTTPLGTFPDITSCPDIPYEFLTAEHILFDLVYNPSVSLFLSRGKEQGAVTCNGLRMLQLQAERSWEIWNS
jgi:shikimate dehydrogenase